MTMGLRVTIFLSFMFLFFTHSLSAQRKEMPQAKQGVLDLRDWQFEKGNVPLTGEWQFFWKQLKKPQDMFAESSANKKYIFVPHASWTVYKEQGKSIPTFGYASYYLKVLLPQQAVGKVLSLDLKNTATSMNIFVNDLPLVQVGTVGKTAQEAKPRYLHDTRSFVTQSNELDLLIQVANFTYAKSGLWTTFSMGYQKNIHQKKYLSFAYDLFLFGVLSIMFFYHIGLVLLQKKEKSYLYFALFTFWFAIRILLRGEMFVTNLLPHINFGLQIRIEYLTYFLGLPFFYWFLYYTFYGVFSKRIGWFISGTTAVFSSLVLFAPVHVFTNSILYFQIFTFAGILLMAYGMLVAVRRKKVGSGITFLGSFIFALTVINDILYMNYISPVSELFAFGLFVFILAQSFVLAKKFSRTFSELEVLSNYLQKLSIANNRFVPQDLLNFLTKKDVVDFNLGDYRSSYMSVLFCDIHNFIEISESMTPKESFGFLNSYFKNITPSVKEHYGFIDKYIGDGIMALFPTGSENAIGAAIKIHKKIRDYNYFYQQNNIPDIRAGIAIHSGMVMLGAIGENERLTATAVSPTVSIASRLETMTKLFGSLVIVSEQTKKESTVEYQYRRVGKMQFSKDIRPSLIYEVLDACSEQQKNLRLKTRDSFDEALRLFEKKEFEKAKEKFEGITKINPDDLACIYYLNYMEFSNVS